MKKIISGSLAVVLMLSMTACAPSADSTCEHSYYLADHKEASADKDGYNEYVCSECDKSYKELIPAGSTSAAGNNTGTQTPSGETPSSPTTAPTTAPSTPVATEPIATEPVATEPVNTTSPGGTASAKKDLFSMPLYSSSVRGNLSFYPEAEDIAGWMHDNCYVISGIHHTKNGEYYVRYELNGEYSKLSGKIAVGNLYWDHCCAWVEFYDGETLIHSTELLSKTAYELEYSIDVTNVEYLTIHFHATDSSVQLYLDDTVLE